MKRVPLAAMLLRAHPADADALAPADVSGGWRWDDYRPDDERRFHVLYTADSAEGALIEKFQKFPNDNAEAQALEALIDGLDSVPEVPTRTVPASVLRSTAIATIAVLDPTASVVDPFDHDTLQEFAAIAAHHNIDKVPNLMKPGDLGTAAYDTCQRVAAIIHDVTDAAGIVSRSSLDNPRDETVHTNYSLFRALPLAGAALRVDLRRTKMSLVLEDHLDALLAACAHLGVKPGLPLMHPEMIDNATEASAVTISDGDK